MLADYNPQMSAITHTGPATAARRSFARLAVQDLVLGLIHWRVWGTLGWQDIRQRYRRSILGPFWITASLGVSIGALGLIYSAIFHVAIHDYVPYVATGFLVWTLISSLLNEGGYAFIAADNTIKQMPLPLSTYVYRMVWRNLIVFGHNFIIYLVVAAWFSVRPGWGVLWAFPGLALLVANGIAWGLLLGVLCARFRDIPQLVTNFLQVIYYVTPLLWKSDLLGKRAWIAGANPFTYLIEIVRGPLLGIEVPLLSWGIALGVTGVGLAAAALLYVKFRWRIRTGYKVLQRLMASVRLDNVSVRFPIYQGASRSLRYRLMAAGTGGRIAKLNDHICVEALTDISFELEHGDRLALVGHNGAGKTTLLRVIAGIYTPEVGHVVTDGRIAPLFDPGFGMDHDATGFDNIYIRGLYLGMSKAEVESRIDDIVEFTELGEFLNMPMRTYSLGMQTRLSFAISTTINPEILLLDESIAAGDASFIEKANRRMHSFIERTGVLVLASHTPDLLQKFCNKGLLIRQGRMVKFGALDEVLDTYQKG